MGLSMRGLQLAATAAFALLGVEWTPPAQSAELKVTCSVTTAKGDQVTYAFDGELNTQDTATFKEVGYTRNGQTPPNYHGGFWRAHEETMGDGGYQLVVVPYETPDYALIIWPASLQEASSSAESELTHNDNFLGAGLCSLERRSPLYQPPPQPYRPSVPYQDSVSIKVIDNSSFVDVYFGFETPLSMMIDTGASMMSLPQVAADLLVAAHKADWAGRSETFTMADGSTHEKRILIIHQIKIGSHTLTNVEAGVTPSNDTVPLLPFPVLAQIGKFTIDTNAGTLTFG
jgi:hypothetical protein